VRGVALADPLREGLHVRPEPRLQIFRRSIHAVFREMRSPVAAADLHDMAMAAHRHGGGAQRSG
jgi:hypothetical protein